MKSLLKIVLTAAAVVVLSYLLPGVEVSGFAAALIVAAVLAVLRVLVKPVLIVLTFPITVVTLGLFLLVVNAIIILIADGFISGFAVRNIWWAVLFSVLLSFMQSILYSMLKEDKKKA